MKILNKYLLSLSILFSVFTFYGFVSNSTSQQSQTPQTELVLNKTKNSKRIFSYKSTFLNASQFHSLHFSLQENKNNITSQNHSITIKLNTNKKEVLNFNTLNFTYQNKINPEISDTYPTLS